MAALGLQPVDRLPFWPKIGGPYAVAQEAPFNAMDGAALHEWVGSDQHLPVGDAICERRTSTSVESSRDGNTNRTAYRTPGGETEMVSLFEPASHSWHPVTFPVRTRADIDILKAIYDDVTVELDGGALDAARARAAEIGDSAVAVTTIGTTPIMQWVQHLAGVAEGHYLLVDEQEAVEALFESMARVLVERARLIAETTPADAIYLVENTSTSLISPDQYRRYCYPLVKQCGEITRAAGRPMILHMCGLLKDILPDLSALPVEAFEAFTSPPVGNTTFGDGRAGCPDKCLIGGTSASLWLEPAETIIAELERDLGELPHHRGVVVTSAGVMPPLCKPETIKRVRDWVAEYPERV